MVHLTPQSTVRGSRPALKLLALLCLLALVSAACKSAGANEDPRLQKMDAAVTRLKAATERIDALEEKDTTLDSSIQGFGQQLSAIEASLADLSKQVEAAKGPDAATTKKLEDLTAKLNSLSSKIDSVSTKVNAVDQRLWVLENRYNDHLRKYHSG